MQKIPTPWAVSIAQVTFGLASGKARKIFPTPERNWRRLVMRSSAWTKAWSMSVVGSFVRFDHRLTVGLILKRVSALPCACQMRGFDQRVIGR